MTDEEIEKIAKKVLELQKAEGVKTTQSLLTFQEVQLGGKEFDNAVQVADKLYKLVLGVKE
jgi:hypothetical protein